MVNQSGNISWSNALEKQSFVLPLCFTLICAGLAGYYGKLDIVAIALLAITSMCVQIVNNLGRIYGDRISRSRTRNEYYERKFEQYKRVGRSVDPTTGTAGDFVSMQVKSMLVMSVAASLVFGYALVFWCFGAQQLSVRSLAITVFALMLMLVILRYVGPWQYGYRAYGNAIIFVLLTGAAVGAFYLLASTFVLVIIYPAAGVGALGVAIANITDLQLENSDAELSQTHNARRTVPLAMSIEGAMILQIVAMIAQMIWLVAFPFAMGSTFAWNYAFCVFFIPQIIQLTKLRRATPKSIPALRRSLSISNLALGVAFFFSMSTSTIVALF